MMGRDTRPWLAVLTKGKCTAQSAETLEYTSTLTADNLHLIVRQLAAQPLVGTMHVDQCLGGTGGVGQVWTNVRVSMHLPSTLRYREPARMPAAHSFLHRLAPTPSSR